MQIDLTLQGRMFLLRDETSTTVDLGFGHLTIKITTMLKRYYSNRKSEV